MHTGQKIARRLFSRIMAPAMAAKAHRACSHYEICERYKRIYHYHVRKTAGTSLNTAFLSIIGASLRDIAHRNFLMQNDFVFVQHDKKLIERGDYFYANSHFPAHQISLPPNTFTITILRDPLERVVSHYRHLVWVRDDPRAPHLEPAIWRLRRELDWLGSGLGEFVSRLPRTLLLNQLYMFSNDFSVSEAAERIAACSYVGFTENFAAHVAELAGLLDLPLQLSWERRFGQKLSLPAADLEIARALLQPEYDLLRLVEARLHQVEARDRASAG
jgi:hypothetical protein